MSADGGLTLKTARGLEATRRRDVRSIENIGKNEAE